ncbi:unnamed protein product [Camellia sinensis]
MTSLSNCSSWVLLGFSKSRSWSILIRWEFFLNNLKNSGHIELYPPFDGVLANDDVIINPILPFKYPWNFVFGYKDEQ